jgi:hypothetical protein
MIRRINSELSGKESEEDRPQHRRKNDMNKEK